MTMSVMALIVGLLVGLLLVLQLAFSSMTLISEPQLTVLEAGFESLKGSVVLSSSFFSLVALFVLFDMELILLFPGVLFHPFLGKSNFFYLFLLLVVLISLLFEWAWFGLKWQI